MKNTTNKETVFLVAFFSGAGIIVLGVILGIALFGAKFKPVEVEKTTASTTASEVVINPTDNDSVVPYKDDSDNYQPSERITKNNKTAAYDNGSITIDSKKQYELNKFMSNFSETNLTPNNGKPHNYDLIEFGLNHCHCNKYEETIEFFNDTIIVNDNYCHERLKCDEVIKTVKKYFGKTLSTDDFYGYPKYKDGYVYCDCTGGFRTWGFTVVNRIEKRDSNTYTLYYDIYDDFNYDFDDSMYRSTPADMANSNIQHFGSGTAVISATNLNDRGTFTLKSYSPSRTF